MVTGGTRNKLVLGLVGPICSGKEVIIDYLEKKYHASAFSLSDQVKEELKSIGFSYPSRETLQATGNLLRKLKGSSTLAIRVAKRVNRQNAKLVLIDGIRHPDEATYLQRNIKSFYLAAVKAEPRIRFKRLIVRGRKGDPVTWESFIASEEKENNQLKILITMKKADLSLENNSTFAKLYGKIDALLKKLKYESKATNTR